MGCTGLLPLLLPPFVGLDEPILKVFFKNFFIEINVYWHYFHISAAQCC